MIGDFSLHQLATDLNHIHQTRVHQVLNILQLLLATNPHVFKPIDTKPGISDHFILSADADLKPSIQRVPRRKVYKFSKANVDGLKTGILNFAKDFLKEADNHSVEEKPFKKSLGRLNRSICPPQCLILSVQTPKDFGLL